MCRGTSQRQEHPFPCCKQVWKQAELQRQPRPFSFTSVLLAWAQGIRCIETATDRTNDSRNPSVWTTLKSDPHSWGRTKVSSFIFSCRNPFKASSKPEPKSFQNSRQTQPFWVQRFWRGSECGPWALFVLRTTWCFCCLSVCLLPFYARETSLSAGISVAEGGFATLKCMRGIGRQPAMLGTKPWKHRSPYS